MEIIENNFRVVCLENDQPNELLDEAVKLRYQIFKEELAWVPANEKGREIDEYDHRAIHFIALKENDNTVVGYVRLIPPGNGFMFEGPFRELITKSEMDTLQSRRKTSAEISRLAVRKEFRGGRQGLFLKMLLFGAMYHWSTTNHSIRYWYMVVTPELHKFLKRLCPCTVIGNPMKLKGDQTVSIALRIDPEEGKESLAQEHPKFFEWFLRGINVSRAH